MEMQNDIVSENPQSTVVAQYERTTPRAEAYQSEAELEQGMIAQLQRQGYEYAHIHHEDELIQNLRLQLEKLNDFHFSDNEWERFFKAEIANEGKGIIDKAETIQRDNIKAFTLDDGTQKNIYLIDQQDPHHNSTQVINQYEVSDGKRPNRYDVTILVNGLPLVHIELKRRGVSLKEAFNQINRYGRESFWAGCSLYEYVQIFVISNGTETKYYSNTTRDSHIREQAKQGKKPRQKTCNSFEFTSYWADAKNKVLGDLEDFTATFLTRHSLLNILTKFCVFTDQKILMVMRPYQIAATEKLLNQIEIAHNAKLYGTRDAGGYVWHTTGSGKTLTSFKAAQLASKLPYIEKVLFVVDRKDLDYQTMKEYDRFQKGAANGNTSTKELEKQLNNSKSRIIITTIQKLANFIKKNPDHDIYRKEVVMIFDECHRSQFGDMHTAITKRFKKYYLFGFTGTPIFVENISASSKGTLKTTEDVFGKRLHAYTIVDAIRDHNVLKFPNYYKDVSQRMKNREIDLLIVVNMFLTGFDATTLNTLWVDKNLRYHGLLQAYSRTNRILNSVKTYGNIVCFRNLEDATNKCLALFGDPTAKGVSILRPFEDYFDGYEEVTEDENGEERQEHVKGYTEYLEELRELAQPDEMPLTDADKKRFIKLFGGILKIRNLLTSFDQFAEQDPLSERDLQDYTSIYLSLRDWAKENAESGDKTNINDDIEFEMELVKQVEVNIDYILFLVQQMQGDRADIAELTIQINKAIDSSPDLRDKKDLINRFIESLTPDSEVTDKWKEYVDAEKRKEFERIVSEEHLKEGPAKEFIETAWERGYVPEGGLELNAIMPPINPFDPNANREGKLQKVLGKIKGFFGKFFEIAGGEF